MKKLVLSLTLIIGLLSLTYAQDDGEPLTSKKGFIVLPEAGDYAIGVDAAPFITLFGNLAAINNGGATYNANFNFLTTNNTIYGKYFVDANTAYRGKIRIGMNNVSNGFYVNDDSDTVSTVPTYVEDVKKTSTKTIMLGAGMEKRRGHGRLQGFYGAEALISFAGGTKDVYEYGNAITADNTNPTNAFGFFGARTLEEKTGSTLSIGARAFAGVEYFILPKICLGGEFGWGILFSKTGEGNLKQEQWDGATSTIVETETPTGGSGQFLIDTDNNTLVTGTVFLLFHF